MKKKRLLTSILIISQLLGSCASVVEESGYNQSIDSSYSENVSESSGAEVSEEASMNSQSASAESEEDKSLEESKEESDVSEVVTEMDISSEKALLEILDKDGKTIVLDENITKINLNGEIKAEKLIITTPLSIYLGEKVDISEGVFFEVSTKGEIFIENISKTDVNLEAPLCNVVWVGKGVPSMYYMEKQMNVFSYNGKETNKNMGGLGSAKLSKIVFIDKSGKEFEGQIYGNTVSIESSYTNPIDVNDFDLKGDFTEKAVGKLISKDNKQYYVITDKAGKTRGYEVCIGVREYKLPIINITTDKPILSKDEYVNGSFSMDYNGQYTFAPIENSEIKIKGRGNSSWKLDKKPYKFKFSEKISLFGLTEAKTWVLIANHADRSLIRNQIAYRVGAVLDNMVFVPEAYMVDLFVNGKYMGVFQLSEQIEVKDGRIPGETDSTEVDTDYLFELGGDETETYFGDNVFNTELFIYAEIKNPDSGVLTKEQFNYIKGYVTSVEEAVVNGGDYSALMDVPSLVDWLLLYEFSYNIDGMFRRSDYLLKKKGGKMYFCTPWDFDYAFGNLSLDTPEYNDWICLGTEKTDNYDHYIPENILDYLMKDPEFIALLKARWDEVGQSMLKAAMDTIDSAEKNVSASAIDNFALWNITGIKIQYENRATVNIHTYEGQLKYLRDWVKKRYNWMDKEIRNMK